MKHRHLALISLFCMLFPCCIHAESLRIGIAETADAYTHILGLGSLLTSESQSYTDFSNDFETGVFPNLSTTDLLLVGSFLTNDPQKKATWVAGAGALRSFVENGGMVVVLCQADQDMASESWVQPPRAITRSDTDLASLQILSASHILLTTPEIIGVADLTNWRVPTTWGAFNTGWETFSGFAHGAAILGNTTASNIALLEMGWGTGRALFYAMAIDKAHLGGNAVSQTASVKFLRNILHYAALVKAGTVPAVVTSSSGYPYPVRGTVFSDLNANGARDSGEPGWAGARVSDGHTYSVSGPDGAYLLPNVSQDARFVFVSQPNDSAKSSRSFYRILAASDLESVRYDLPLLPANTSQPSSGVLFAQITDIHTRADLASRNAQARGLQEIAGRNPQPAFVVATGDLCETGVSEQFQNFNQAAASAGLPCFPIIGNHDNTNGAGYYNTYMGPDYYAFDHGGVHFVARNVISPSARQDAWLQNDLGGLTSGTPVVFMQHFPPSAADLNQFGARNVKLFLSGHWHSDKQVEAGGAVNQNSPSFVMGGIDCSPAGYRLVRMSSNGAMSTEWCYGGMQQRLALVSPSSPLPNWSHGFPIIVNGYDSSNPPEAIQWTLTQSGQTILTGQLRQNSELNWSGEFASPMGSPVTGLCNIRIAVADTSGKAWQMDRDIMLDAREPAPVMPAAHDWPMFMGNAARNGTTSDATTVPMRLAWSTATGGGLDFSSPILAEGRLYIAYKSRGSLAGSGVMALNPANGQAIWDTRTSFSINHSPAYSSGIICAAEVGGRVYGLNAQTGAQVWQKNLLSHLDRYSYCAPAAKGGKFYVGTMRRLSKITASNGSVDWEANPNGNDWISSYGSPAVGESQIAMAGNGLSGTAQNVAVLQESNGGPIRGYTANGGVTGSASIHGNSLLFASQNSMLYCVDLTSGTQTWAKSLGGGWSASTPAISNGTVVCASGDGQVRAFALSTGASLWSFSAGPSILNLSPYRRDTRGLFSSPTIAFDKVFLGSSDGYLYCLSLESGQVLWSYYFGVPVLSTPLVSGNALFVGAYDGRVYGFTVSNVEPAAMQTSVRDEMWSRLD